MSTSLNAMRKPPNETRAKASLRRQAYLWWLAAAAVIILVVLFVVQAFSPTPNLRSLTTANHSLLVEVHHEDIEIATLLSQVRHDESTAATGDRAQAQRDTALAAAIDALRAHVDAQVALLCRASAHPASCGQ